MRVRSAVFALADCPLLDNHMIEAQLIGKHISEFADVLGFPVTSPARPPEGDPEFGMDRYIELPDHGLTILVSWSDTATCVMYFAAGVEEGYSRYGGFFPHGLTFENSRSEVRQAMGEPVRSSDGGPDWFEPIRPWDWFVSEGRKVHFQYQDSCAAIRRITVEPLPSMD